MNTQTKPQTAGERLLEAARVMLAWKALDDSPEWRKDYNALLCAIAAYESQPDELNEALDALDDCAEEVRLRTGSAFIYRTARAVLQKHGRTT